ncbi:MAG: FCD domain-containing protein [Oscillospiraceae bacterium]
MSVQRTPSTKPVVDKIVDFIQSAAIPVGSHLPSERHLAQALGETRGQIRKAINEMEHNGMVETVPQVGTILKSQSPCVTTFQKLMNMGTVDIPSLIEVRVSLEVTAAGLAAKRATESDLLRMQAACEEYEKEASAYSPWHEENIRFHMEIIRSSRNAAIVAIMENLLNDAVVFTRSKQSSYTQERLNRSINEHKAIVAAIKSRDEAAAVRAMGIHMGKMSAMADELNRIME